MSEAEKIDQDKLTQWVTFTLADETYGLDVMRVQEVLRVSEITPVPGAQDFILGIINLRGNVVTVIDTRSRFGLPVKEQDDQSRIIIIESQEHVIGLLVDSVSEVAYLHESEIDSAPSTGADESSKYIHGVHSTDGKLLILVDVNKIVTDEDLMDL